MKYKSPLRPCALNDSLASKINLAPKNRRGDCGRAGEATVRADLIRQGYAIWHTNWRCNAGEIDLIAQHADTLVFIEVKAGIRATQRQIALTDRISYRQEKRIAAAIHIYCSNHAYKIEKSKITACRVDLITVDFQDEQLTSWNLSHFYHILEIPNSDLLLVPVIR